jgi:putative transposase
MVRVYRYRLYPSRAQDAALRQTLERLRELYNAALQERRDAYQKQGVRLSAYGQMAELRGVREVREDIAGIHVHLLQDAITRLDRAYRAFFRRLKGGEKPGYPRFRGKGRYRTFTFKDAKNRNGARLVAGAKRLDLAGIGKVKIKLHRPLQGTIKQIAVTLSGDGHWYAAFVCADVAPQPLAATGARVGIDVGITSFATLSNGEPVENPRPYQCAQRKLKTAQRRVSRRKNGSARRRAAVVLLAKQHDKVQRVRRDFHHKTALRLVERFDSIAVEDLNIRGLAGSMLAKQVHDAGWAQFTTILAGKAESAGREFAKVDPRGTSQDCSGCGTLVRKTLSVRVHACPECGLVMDRDHNAAINVLRRGHRLRRGLDSRPNDPRSPGLAQ